MSDGDIYYSTITGNTNSTITGNPTGVTWTYCPTNSILLALDKEETKIKIEGVEIMKLYDVYLVYAETRLAPFFMRKDNIIAKDPEDAKIKSGLMKEVLSHWDSDYLTFITKEIGEVKVKEKPKEVKNVNV
jgi:hypothetical protein